MNIIETKLKDCFILELRMFVDYRGVFFESFHKQNLESILGRTINFVQDNHSISKMGVLRGLHFQKGEAAQAKLVRVIKGRVLDVVVDIRPESPTFGKHIKVNLTAKNRDMLYIPKGMAHGFLALTEDAELLYKCDNYYKPEMEGGIIFNDSDIGIDWNFPIDQMILSQKDLKLPKLKDIKL